MKNLTYLDERPVFDKDRACAEAFCRGGIEEERNERDKWVEADRKRINDSFQWLRERRAKIEAQNRELELKKEKELNGEPSDEISVKPGEVDWLYGHQEIPDELSMEVEDDIDAMCITDLPNTPQGDSIFHIYKNETTLSELNMHENAPAPSRVLIHEISDVEETIILQPSESKKLSNDTPMEAFVNENTNKNPEEIQRKMECVSENVGSNANCPEKYDFFEIDSLE